MGTVRLGGRVRRGPLGDVRIVDAFGGLRLDAFPESVTDGSLVVVEGTVVGDLVTKARVLSARSPTETGGADVARLLDGNVGKALAARAHAIAAVRSYFTGEGFIEVETPTLVPSPGLDVHLDAFAVESKGPARFLGTSPEYQMKRLLVGGVPRCFQICRAYRRSELGSRHNPEFTMLEWYRAFADAEDVIDDTEALVVTVLESCASAVPLPSRPFLRLSVAEAFARFANVSEAEMLRMSREDEETFFRLLVDHVEPGIESLETPVIVHRYPASMASLARLCDDDARYAERFEVYVGGIEISNGFGELTCPREQRARFERDQQARSLAGLPVYPIDERFIGALEEGMPPAAGNALGLDRLIMLALGRSTIGDVLAFPEGEL